MKCIVYEIDDGSIAIGMLSLKTLAAMMGSGGLLPLGRVEREIDKRVNPPAPEVGISLEAATTFVNGITSGGMTETEAIEAIQGKSRPAGTVNHHIIEVSEVPDDRTFRNAWEWSD